MYSPLFILVTLACGTWESECTASGSYSYTTTLQLKGTGSTKAVLYAMTTRSYNSTDCSGDMVFEEVVQFEDIDYTVESKYPGQLGMEE